MSTKFEQTLRDALAEQAGELPADATAKLLAADYRARGSIVRAAFPVGAGCLAVAVTVTVLVFGAGANAPRAFAGWSATPTTPTGLQVSRADAACRADLTSMYFRHSLEAPAGLRGDFLASGWRNVLTDVRGPYTMIVLEAKDGQADATCFADKRAQTSLGVAVGVRPPAPVPAGHVHLASSGSSTTPSDEGSRQFSYLVGRTGAGVTGVTIRLNDGTRVRTTCANGWFLAWWPGSHGLAAIEVTTEAGTKTQ